MDEENLAHIGVQQQAWTQKLHTFCHALLKWLHRKYLDVKNSSKREKRKWLRKLQLIHFVLLLLLVLLFLYVTWSTLTGSAGDSPYVKHMRFVSIEEDRIDIHTRSKDVSCEQIQGQQKLDGMDALAMMETAALLMEQYDLQCNCAPLFNVSFRYMSIKDGWSVVHAFNPSVTAPITSHGRALVMESQELLVPGAGTREVVRLNGLTLSYLDQNCVKRDDRAFIKETAWCIQSCIELLEGKTVYD